MKKLFTTTMLVGVFAVSFSANAKTNFKKAKELVTKCEEKRIQAAVLNGLGEDVKKITKFSEVNLLGMFKKFGKVKYKVELTSEDTISVDFFNMSWTGGSERIEKKYIVSNEVEGYSFIAEVTTDHVDTDPCKVIFVRVGN